MRGPIAYGLSWPDRMISGSAALDFANMSEMTFEATSSREHPERFPGLRLAWDVLRAPPGSTVVLNAANEVAVEAFLNGQITWTRISEVIDATLQQHDGLVPTIVEDILHADALARRFALQVLSA